ncbi:hypothetical protein [Dapis sp. BLCC M229]|uniref:hypothetical protein n=1 Tax=Dapis sp. BLCC M229 TaxID=3400188 RepID=UPI003CF6F690
MVQSSLPIIYYLFTRDNNDRGGIIWHLEGKFDFEIPQEWGVKQVSNLAGDSYKLSGLKLEIGSLPLINAYSQDIIKSKINNFRFGKATVVEKYLDFYHKFISGNCE